MAAKEVADELTSPRAEGQEKVKDIQVMISSTAISVEFRDLRVSSMLMLISSTNLIFYSFTPFLLINTLILK